MNVASYPITMVWTAFSKKYDSVTMVMHGTAIGG